jgi:hypothetical protein
MSTFFGAPSTYKSIFSEKHQNLNFWWYFNVSRSNCLWVDFGSFGQFYAVLGYFMQFWVNFAA